MSRPPERTALATDRYIWITRWRDFQHYKPERDRGPAWIKDYTKQLLDERYLGLTDRQRALLRDLRDVFAMTNGRVPDDTRTISRHRHSQTRHADIEALNHAGFIEFCSREVLEHRLEQLYSFPRARVEGERELDRETRAVFAPKLADDPEPALNGPGEDLTIRNQIHESLAQARAAGGTR